MNTDQTANIKVGYMLKYTHDGTVKYGMCTAIASNLLTIGGAAIDTGAGLLTAVSYKREMVVPVYLFVSGPYAAAADTDMILNQMTTYVPWEGPTAYAVKYKVRNQTVETGGTADKVQIHINGADLCTTAAGLSVAANAWTATVVDIDTSGYEIENGELITCASDGGGTNKTAQNLTAIVLFTIA